MKAKLTRIKNFKKNTHIQGFFLVREKHLRSTRTNHPYLQLHLQDNSGSIEAKVWEDAPAFEKTFENQYKLIIRSNLPERSHSIGLGARAIVIMGGIDLNTDNFPKKLIEGAVREVEYITASHT